MLALADDVAWPGIKARQPQCSSKVYGTARRFAVLPLISAELTYLASAEARLLFFCDSKGSIKCRASWESTTRPFLFNVLLWHRNAPLLRQDNALIRTYHKIPVVWSHSTPPSVWDWNILLVGCVQTRGASAISGLAQPRRYAEAQKLVTLGRKYLVASRMRR